MPKFITLTPTNNKVNKVLLNANTIESIFEYGNCTRVHIIGTVSTWWEVKESPESIINLIKREEE